MEQASKTAKRVGTIGIISNLFLLNIKFIVGILIIIIIIACTIVFTFYPPHIPMFKDSITGLYGI